MLTDLTLMDTLYFVAYAFLAGFFTGLGLFMASRLFRPADMRYDNLDKPNAKN